MNTPPLYELDIRPLCATGRPPLGAILSAVNELKEGQALRLIAPFEPTPLYELLGKRDFSHATQSRGDGSFEIVFTPAIRNSSG